MRLPSSPNAADRLHWRSTGTREMAAPWAPGVSYALGRHLLQMVQHLETHKSQLFYYLKLQGVPVGTADLWG